MTRGYLFWGEFRWNGDGDWSYHNIGWILGEVVPDERSAIILFFHDHDWEPRILKRALETPAFYIGAQGSRRARDARHQEMLLLGVKKKALRRLKGPIGLIPSARDPRTLAISVLAEVLNIANCNWLWRAFFWFFISQLQHVIISNQ